MLILMLFLFCKCFLFNAVISCEFRPFHCVTLVCEFSVVSFECLFWFSEWILVFFMIFNTWKSGILLEFWNTIYLMTFTSTHRIHNKFTIPISIFILINLIRSHNIIIWFFRIVHKHGFLWISFWFVQAIKLSWLWVCSVCFCLNFVTQWIACGSSRMIHNFYLRCSLGIQAVTIENLTSMIDTTAELVNAGSASNIVFTDFVFIIILQIICIGLANPLG